MHPTTLEASTIGLLAARALKRSTSATVLACFERSFYLDVGGDVITIGANDLHDGPLNLRLCCAHGAGLTIDLDIALGQRWSLSSGQLCRSDGLVIDICEAAIWQPKIPATVPDRAGLTDCLSHLRRLLHARLLPEEGLIRLALGSPPRTATERAARPLIEALVADLPQWLADDETTDHASAIRLLGLGPGLTPSGDDLLAGLLIAWRRVGATSAADRLGQMLLTAARERTNEISLAHLCAAAQGFAAAPLHRLLDRLVAEQRTVMPEALDAAAKIGHSSGLDAIAGVILALRAWLRADHERTIAA